MPYVSEGTLTTDERETAISESWDTQTEWEQYQSINNVEIVNGTIQLVETTIPSSVTNNLDVWYPMDEESGTTLNDALETVNATLLGGASWSTGGWGGFSPQLDGVDDYLSSNTGISVGSTVSVCGWFNLDTLGSRGGIIGIGDDSTNISNGFEISYIANENRTGSVGYDNGETSGFGGVSGVTSTVSWYFLAAVADSTNSELTQYLWDNTSFLGSSTNTDTNLNFSGGMELFGGFENFNTAYLNGKVDAYGWNTSTALTQTQFGDIWQDTQR